MDRMYTRRTALMRAATMLFAAGMISIWGTPSLKAEDADGPGHEQHMGDRGEGHEGHWKEKLGLSDEQSKRMEAIRTSEKTEMEPLHEKMRVLKEKLRWQVDAKANDKDIKATLDELEISFNSMQSAEKKYRDQKKVILTPTQQAQAFLMMSEHFDRGDHQGPGHEHGMRKEHEDHEDKGE
jgi:Spy/CpxP family protein refolding chaperone